MQIPPQPAATADAALLRRDLSPTQPTAPVAGMAEQAQKLDPRTALRWVQPVFKSESAQLMRRPCKTPETRMNAADLG